MQAHNPSRTAETTAAHRAFESQRPPEDRVCDDPFAERFLGTHWTPFGNIPLPTQVAFWLFEWLLPGWNGYFVARTRHIDETLHTCLEHGLEQLVMLGAGYDSRAYRFDQLKHSATVFEVDHPATQQIKAAKLKELFGAVPDHVTLVPIDFTTHTLQDRLYDSGYTPQRQTLFIWEGVTMYLTPNAVDDTLAFVVNQSRNGSSIIFDYTHPAVINGTCPRREAKMWRTSAKRLGELLHFGIEEGTIEAFLTQRGFSQVRNVNHRALKQLYFHGRNQRRTITPIIEIVHATVR